ncbi:MAG TPA: MCP four helix bundle domain-containing protein, partial [Kofleriaceae bacterium]|nr:MCP four helix bundle domain-containing protein [Kofleriaceae bacterium]
MNHPIALVAAFAIAMAAFAGSTTYSQWVASHIDVLARSISENATASILHLAAARGEVRHLESLATRYTLQPDPVLEKEVAAAQRDLDQSFARYLAIPPYPRERALWSDVDAAATAFRQAVARTMEAASTANLAEKRPALHDMLAQRGNEAVQRLNEAVAFNAHEGQALADEITLARRRATLVAATLDAVCIVVTLALAWVTISANRRYTGALARERLEAEERADELETFAGRVAHDIRGPLATVSLVLGSVEKRAHDDATRGLASRGLTAVKRANGIVTGLLAFAKAGARPSPAERTALATLLEETVASLASVAEDEHISLTLAPPPHRLVAADPGVMASVMENLIRNGIKYMEGRERRIEVRAIDAGERVRV